jgi:hypothetical protein
VKNSLALAFGLLVLGISLRFESYGLRHAFLFGIYLYSNFYAWRRITNKPVYSGPETISERSSEGTRTMHDVIWTLFYLVLTLILWSPYWLAEH